MLINGLNAFAWVALTFLVLLLAFAASFMFASIVIDISSLVGRILYEIFIIFVRLCRKLNLNFRITGRSKLLDKLADVIGVAVVNLLGVVQNSAAGLITTAAVVMCGYYIWNLNLHSEQEPSTPTTLGRAEPLKAPLRFDSVRLACGRHPPAWSLRDVQQLDTPVDTCQFDGPVHCGPISIVAIGTASATGDPATETQRALERGRNLAGALSNKFIDRCSSQQISKPAIFVLNMGRYRQGNRGINEADQRNLDAVIASADGTISEITEALQTYISERRYFGAYELCELYQIDALTMQPRSVGKLKCHTGE